MTSLTVGAGDIVDSTGDLIVTFVDITGAQGITTDGTRAELPGAPWGCYLIAPNISPQAGCVTTFSPTTARWESCSLIWQPPPHAAVLWTMGGRFDGAAGIAANPRFPPLSFQVAGSLDATASINAGNIKSGVYLAAAVSAAAGFIGALAPGPVRLAGSFAAAAGIAGNVTGSGNVTWPLAGVFAADGGMSARARQIASLAATIGGAASVAGDALRSGPGQQYTLSGSFDAVAGVSGAAIVRRAFFVTATSAAVAGIIPFGGNAPLRISNYITNPRPEGASAGSPGGAPDRWDAYSTDLTRTIVGTGTESQIPYIDIRFNNPASGGGQIGIQFEEFLYAPQGLTWSFGLSCRVVGGSLTNITQFVMVLGAADSVAGSILNFYFGSPFTPTSAALNTQWYTINGAYIADAGMDSISPNLAINYDAGAIDVTLRLGGVRVERTSAASGPQYIVVPQVGLMPAAGNATTFVY